MTSYSFKHIWTYSCPKCRMSKMFKEPFMVMKPLDMNDRCTNCNQSFEPEPGFYFGAMFLSYGIACLVYLPLALLLVFYFDWTINSMLAFVFFLYFAFFFKLLRISRSLWAHLMIKYKPSRR